MLVFKMLLVCWTFSSHPLLYPMSTLPIGKLIFLVYSDGVLCWNGFGLPWPMEDHTKTRK